MKVDEAIAEIRAIRHKISEEHGHDTKALLDYYKELEKGYKDRIISRRLSVGKRPVSGMEAGRP
jgi:hypothetical protein